MQNEWLFEEKNREILLQLVKSSFENGVMDCVYVRR